PSSPARVRVQGDIRHVDEERAQFCRGTKVVVRGHGKQRSAPQLVVVGNVGGRMHFEPHLALTPLQWA
ncbi:hypothetical protein, partial [Thermogutta sp.]|uniref:hypothetical protein n=1 Tax=Thermogutta sp. TaxID=1962930 RepID=UPI003C7B2534